jgi:hypothetical protein
VFSSGTFVCVFTVFSFSPTIFCIFWVVIAVFFIFGAPIHCYLSLLPFFPVTGFGGGGFSVWMDEWLGH